MSKTATIEGTAKAVTVSAAQTVAEIIEHSPAMVLTDPEKLTVVCAQMEKELAEFVPDLTTAKGRDAIKSFAFKFSKSKTAIDDAGKALNAELRAQIDAVDEVRRKIRERFDGYRDKARKPLDEWEAERDRVLQVRQKFVADLHFATKFDPLDTSADVLKKIDQLGAPTIEVWGDDLQDAIDKRTAAIDELRRHADALKEREAQAAELVRLREEKAALVAAETARLAEEQKRQQAEAAAAAAEERKKREKAAEEERVKLAANRARDEEARKARQQQEEQARAHQAEIDRLKRIEEERIAKEKRDEEDRIAREHDQQNRRAKMTATKEAIMAAGEINAEQAREIVIAIAGGSIPNVKMEF